MIRKTYKAASLSEAIHHIKAEMGPKASLVSTVTVPARRTLLKFYPSRVEVIATVDEKHLTHEQMEAFLAGSAQGGAAVEPAQKSRGILSQLFRPGSPKMQFRSGADVGDADAGVVVNARPDGEQLTLLRKKLSALEKENEELKHQMEVMSETQAEVRMIRSRIKISDIEENLSQMHKQKILGELIDSAVSERLMTRWQKLASDLPKDASKDDLILMTAGFFKGILPPFRGQISRKLAFWGPLESGKTLSVMKLACQFAADGKNIAVASVDDSRTGEICELEIFCEELGILHADIRQHEALEDFLSGCSACDHILFDIGSIESDDSLGIKRLKNWLDRIEATNLAVFSAENADNAHLYRQYEGLVTHGIICTHLDGKFRAGAILNLADEAGKPVYYFGTGQDLLGDFERATAETLVALMPRLNQPEKNVPDAGSDAMDRHEAK